MAGIVENAFATNQFEASASHLGYIHSAAHDEPTCSLSIQNNSKQFSWDDVTERPLDSKLVRQARMEESVKLERSLFDLYKDFTK